MADRLTDRSIVGPREPQPSKSGAAAVSIVSNSTLILLKLVAGAVTGSVAIITEAMHSSIDLVASIIAWFSVRKADVPADAEHRYGHQKIENVAAAIEGMLILVGSGVIIFESTRRLVNHSEVDSLGFGIAVIAFSGVANLAVSAFLKRRAAQTDSPALEGDAAHLRTDAYTSFGVLGGLVLVQITGATWIDPVVALLVAGAIVYARGPVPSRPTRGLVDAAPPAPAPEAVRAALLSMGGPGGA